MKELKLIILAIFISFLARAQTAEQYVLSTAGGEATLGGGQTLSFTIGEGVIETIGSNPQLTQGFQQKVNMTVLPVNLVNYTVNAEGVTALLQWKTVSEKNNDHYMLEKSIDGKFFSMLGSVSAQNGGTSNTSVQYTYRDTKPADGINYYRLTQFDKDGKSAFLGTQSLSFDFPALRSATIYPNPAKDIVNINLNGNNFKSVILSDMGGRILETKSINDKETIQFKIEHLPAGTYLIRLEGDSKSINNKLIKQ